jgi:hypothetical protein
MLLLLSITCALIVGSLIGYYISNFFNNLLLSGVERNIVKNINYAYDEGVKNGMLQAKIERINEISNEQIQIFGALDQPNASAAHGRYKNSLVSKIKAMEEEKLDLFRSMLKDGADPTMSIRIDGEAKTMKASQLLPYLESGLLPEDKIAELKTDPNPTSKTRILRVVKNTEENKDVKSNAGDSAVH